MDLIGTILSICVVGVILVPIHGAFWLGIRAENRARRKLLQAMWIRKLGGRR